jgi:hypothetical protein
MKIGRVQANENRKERKGKERISEVIVDGIMNKCMYVIK